LPEFDVHTLHIYNAIVQFEWDEAKRATNVSKHGVDFVDAPEMFQGPMLIRPDERKTMGRLRKANSREKTLFQETLKDQLEKN
jgi:uncharacterized DUF497 family protein